MCQWRALSGAKRISAPTGQALRRWDLFHGWNRTQWLGSLGIQLDVRPTLKGHGPALGRDVHIVCTFLYPGVARLHGGAAGLNLRFLHLI